jgi:hypothetical protein
MKKLLVLSLAMLLCITVTAQEKIAEGIMTIKQTISSDNEQMNAQLASMSPPDSKTYFKGDKSRSDTSSPMTGDIAIIINGAEKQMLMLMDQPSMGKKYMLQSTDPSAEDMANVKVEKGNETKTIMGYECQQYRVTMKQNGQEVEMEMFTTDQISAISQNTTAMGQKVDGFPLYYVLKMSQMGAIINVVSEVIKIDKETVSDATFSMIPPEGYTKMEGM